ncbi:uncharacterized protein LOC129911329 [Episyrphus balteatus]|uniref:uncharacterized protein LOC129911329 n=1 Tax=Episyrphus balteatus TaxID=286459 RepID=UPI00248694AB|nr:uncharacterized protein LOC129911329 [Episyrphus balteatus]
MNVADSFYETFNKSLEGFALQTEKLINVSIKFALNLRTQFNQATDTFQSPIEFTELQITLLKVLLLILLTNLVLIGFAWRKFGQVITEKFVEPSTLKEIEELKLSVAKLKLPKEHSPRI